MSETVQIVGIICGAIVACVFVVSVAWATKEEHGLSCRCDQCNKRRP